MSLITNRFLVTATPQLVVPAFENSQTAVFTLPFGSVFLGPTNTVTSMTGFPVNGSPQPVTLPIPPNTELWAMAVVQDISPVTLFVTVSEGPLLNSELRAAPVEVTGTVDAAVPNPLPVSFTTPYPVSASGTFPVSFPTPYPVTAGGTFPVSFATPVPVTLPMPASASAPVSVTIGTTSALLVAANASRKGLRIRVLTDKAVVSLAFGQTAVINKGVTLTGSATGGGSDSFIMDAASFLTVAINAVASASNTLVSVQEFV
jgi:hypothetical protein